MSEADRVHKSPLQIIGQPDSLMEPMEQKENFCLVQENSSMSFQTKRNRKGIGSNLRNSLAWNQAFFTEEGVLDPTELSCLSKSSSKSAGKSLLLNEISPPASYYKTSVNPSASSLCKDLKPRKLFQSSNIELKAQTTGGKALSSKGSFKSIPRSPSTNLQKRGLTTTTNLKSKVPKFTKPPSASRASSNPMPPTSNSKIDKSTIKVCAEQSPTVRSPTAKMDFACSSLSSNFSAAHGKSLGKLIGADLKEYSNVLSAHRHDIVTCGPAKQVTKSPSRTVNNIPRPSALRMPSPSLGFFSQGKASTSYDVKPHRPLQESKRLPIMLPKKLKQKTEKNQLQPQPTSFDQQVITEEHSCCSNSSSPDNTSILVKTDSEMNSERVRGSMKSGNDSFIQDQKDISSSVHRNLCDEPAKDFDKILCSVESQTVCGTVDVKVHDSGNIADAPIESSSMNDASCFHDSRLGSYMRDDYLDCSSDVIVDIASEIHANVSAEARLLTEEGKKGNELKNNEQLRSVLPSSPTNAKVTNNCTLVEKNESNFDEKEFHDLYSDSISKDFSLSEKSDTYFDEAEIQDSPCNSTCVNSSANSDLLNRRKMTGGNISRQDILLNVVPFSDEWVAALEAFGEEILVEKTGAVQNSPTDKSLPEPGPWSPVKKVQEVGPFDCTKHRKNYASSSTD